MPGFEALRERVVGPGLCARCGACAAVCPTGGIAFDDHGHPLLAGSCSHCSLCLRVCPGGEVNLPALHRAVFGTPLDPADHLGTRRGSFIGYASDAAARQAGASGGVITGLLVHLLETGRIGGALVCGPDSAVPWGSRGLLARSRAELLSSGQSRYTFVPSLALLRDWPPDAGPLAVTALPCQVHALRLMEEAAPTQARKVGLVVGLYCHFNLELTSVLDMLAAHRVDPSSLARLEYRGGPWPGGIRAVLRDGGTLPLHRVGIKEIMTFLLRRYSPVRCHLCVDAAAELADLSVGDFWSMDYRGELAVEKHSLVTCRTARGEAALDRAREAGVLVLKELPPESFSRRTMSFFREKKHNAWLRMARRERRGLPVPRYGLFPPPLTGADRRRELANRLTMACRGEGFDRLLTRLYLSRAGELLVRLNDRRKNLLGDFRVG